MLVGIVWLGRRSFAALGPLRRVLAVVLRCLIVFILIALLAGPMLTRTSERLTVIAVVDRSLSIPSRLQAESLDWLTVALGAKDSQGSANGGAEDRVAIVDVAEAASISQLPSTAAKVRQRNTTLTGQQTRLSDGIQMAMAIAPPDTATRILLVSEGNETAGDLKEAARLAAANRIPIDVLPLRYRYDREVVFRRLAAPGKARSGQTVSLRFILDSAASARGRLMLSLNDKPVDLDPDSPEIAVAVELEPGTNVHTVSVPVGAQGMHEFEAVFIPEDAGQDVIAENNRACAVTYVAGPGYVRIFDTNGAGAGVARAMEQADLYTSCADVELMPMELTRLLDTDVVVLVNTPIHYFTIAQQEMLVRYVSDLGGGLVMIGGDAAFGAGGWIDSPVAEILPVDLDPPQKKQMPRGALVLVIDRSGSMVGQKVEICKVSAAASVRLLSRLDLVGVIVFDAVFDWLVPLGPAGEKDDIYERLRSVGAGGGTTMGPPMQAAFESVRDAKCAVKHVIVLTDGMTSDPDFCAKLAGEMDKSQVSVSTVAVGDHCNTELLHGIAAATQGRFYYVQDPMSIPAIFVKEAQVIRRSMIMEETFSPEMAYSMSEVVKGISPPLPALDGYVLTGPKGGLNQTVLAKEGDPILATCQSGLGRCVAFTSSADSRWASNWLAWGGFERFWEQTVRWAAKPAQSADCDVFADVQGRDVTINVEAIDPEGKFIQFTSIEGQVIAPDISSVPLELLQIGPGQYRGRFQAGESGSYIVNLQYRKVGEDAKTHVMQTTVTVPFAPEFRDLSDNEPLLAEVSKVTGGRILPRDPNMATVYDHSGLKFPRSQMPLTKPLMFLWLALFLLDVAVRRVVVDFRAMARRVVALIRSVRGQRKVDQTIERLKARQAKIREKLSASRAEALASKRYQASEEYKGDLPAAKATETPKPKPEIKEPEEEAPKKDTEQASHIDRLLKAKQKAKERKKNEKTSDDD